MMPPERGTAAPAGQPFATAGREGGVPAVVPDTQQAQRPRAQHGDADQPSTDIAASPAAADGRRRVVLIIEDDADARRALRLAVSDEGFTVLEAADGRQGLRLMAQQPDIVLLDLMLPNMSGTEVLKTLRAATNVPVIIVSGRSDSADVVDGLHAGADDYVVKPVLASVLTARIQALLRRAAQVDPTGTGRELRLGSVALRPDEQSVHKNGQELSLTKTEFRLLCELAAHPGQVITREQLLLRVWGYDYFGDTRLLDVHIRRLRTKVEDDPGEPTLIRTVRGVGYKIQP